MPEAVSKEKRAWILYEQVPQECSITFEFQDRACSCKVRDGKYVIRLQREMYDSKLALLIALNKQAVYLPIEKQP